MIYLPYILLIATIFVSLILVAKLAKSKKELKKQQQQLIVAKDSYNSLLAIGMTAFIFLEFLINISMVIGMFPVVGMPLPLFSYGGSSLLTICIALGILVSIDRDNSGAQQSKIPGN